MFELDWKMLTAFTVLLTFHGSIFLRIAKNIFITRDEHETFLKTTKAEQDILSKKIDNRLFDDKNGMPIYVSQIGCDRRIVEDNKRHDKYASATCNKIDELKKDVKKLRDIIFERMAIAGQ